MPRAFNKLELQKAIEEGKAQMQKEQSTINSEDNFFGTFSSATTKKKSKKASEMLK